MHLHLALLVVYVAVQARGATLRQYDHDWLMDDAVDSSLTPRRITAKSVFVAPSNVRCSPGWRANADGRCVRVVTVRQEAQIQFLSDKLNALFGSMPLHEKVTAIEMVSVESSSSTSEKMTTSERPLVETSTLVSEEENIGTEVVEFSGDGPMEVDIWDIYPNITTSTDSLNHTSVEDVFIVPENEITSTISSTESTEGLTGLDGNSTEVASSTAETTFMTETLEVVPVVIVVEPAKLIKDVSHGVDSVQVLEADLEMVTSESEAATLEVIASEVSTLETTTSATTSSEETTMTTSEKEYTSDPPDETTMEVDIVESVNSDASDDDADRTNATVNTNHKPLTTNHNTHHLGVAADNVQIVYAQNPNTNNDPPSTSPPLIIDLKPNENTFTGVQLQNHNLNPSKFEPSYPDNQAAGFNKFPDYPFSLDEIRNRRPLGEDFHHRESFVRFPNEERVDHRVNVVKFPQDHGYNGDKFNRWNNAGYRGNSRYRPPPPPVPAPPLRYWPKMPFVRDREVQQQPPRRPQYDRRRPPPVF